MQGAEVSAYQLAEHALLDLLSSREYAGATRNRLVQAEKLASLGQLTAGVEAFRRRDRKRNLSSLTLLGQELNASALVQCAAVISG